MACFLQAIFNILLGESWQAPPCFHSNLNRPPVGYPALLIWFRLYTPAKAIVLFSFEGLLYIPIYLSGI